MPGETSFDSGLPSRGVFRPQHQREPVGVDAIGDKPAVHDFDRDPDFGGDAGIDAVESGLCHSDYAERHLIVLNNPSEDGGIGMEALRPEGVAEDGDRLTCIFVTTVDKAAGKWL